MKPPRACRRRLCYYRPTKLLCYRRIEIRCVPSTNCLLIFTSLSPVCYRRDIFKIHQFSCLQSFLRNNFSFYDVDKFGYMDFVLFVFHFVRISSQSLLLRSKTFRFSIIKFIKPIKIKSRLVKTQTLLSRDMSSFFRLKSTTYRETARL